jgi:transcriptional regulator with XRE-family HTH domain
MVGPQIRRIRGESNLTQIALAERCQRLGWDISRDTLAKIEAQSRWVADFELAFLARVLSVSPEALFPPHPVSTRAVRDFIKRLETITK